MDASTELQLMAAVASATGGSPVDDAALAAIANDLYALHPTRFTAARNARAAELRAADASPTGRVLADAVATLRRPSPAAWLANLVVRERRTELDEVLALGPELRRAQQGLDRGELTRLGAERRRLIGSLVTTAGELASEAGHAVGAAVTDALTETLQAALADSAAADALLTGRLLRALTSVGFDAVDLTDAVAAPADGPGAVPSLRTRTSRALHAVDDAGNDLVRREVERALAAASDAAAHAATALADAEARVADLAMRRRDLAVELQDLEDELTHTRRAISAADRESRSVDRQRESARRAADRAEEKLQQARDRRARLDQA